jgi:hypothetical protein
MIDIEAWSIEPTPLPTEKDPNRHVSDQIKGCFRFSEEKILK